MTRCSPRRDALVLASHLPGEGHFRSERFSVAPIPCVDDFDYWQGLDAHWSHPGPLVLVEHDMEVSEEHVAALIACPEPLCSWAYRVNWASTGLPHPIFAQQDADGDPVGEGDEWAAQSGIGLVKVSRSARVAPLRREPWPRVELAVRAAVRGPWHVHWPAVPHWHF